MDNQSKGSFQQDLFKQRECERKKKRSPEQTIFILQRGASDTSLAVTTVPVSLLLLVGLGRPSSGPSPSSLPHMLFELLLQTICW